MVEHEALFEMLADDPGGFLAAHRPQVVASGWAEPFSGLHVPEPLYLMRQSGVDRNQVLRVGDPPPDEHFVSEPMRYGLDASQRIVTVRGTRRHWRAWECILVRSPAGEVIWQAGRGDSERGRAVELTSYRYEQGRMAACRRTSEFRARKDSSREQEQCWFRYDADGRLELVIWVTGEPGSRSLYPRAQWLTWSETSELELVTETYGLERVDRVEDPEAQLAAVLRWEQRPGIERSIVYDARISRIEHDIPPEAEVWAGLHVLVADAIQAAVAAAVADGRVSAPFLIRTDVGFPPSLDVVEDRSRQRRRELPAQDHELFFPDTIRLNVIDHASEEALRRMRQALQSSKPTPPPPLRRTIGPGRYMAPRGITEDEWEARRQAWSRELERISERDQRYARDLQFELNRRQYPGATSDLVALVGGSLRRDDGLAWLAEQLGDERVAAFRASLQPTETIKRPRGPGQLRDLDDVRLLLRSRGIREHHIEPIVAEARWALRLVRGEGDSRLGGIPHLPAGVEWPRFDERPLDFLALLELTELPEIAGREALPADGQLLFFFALDEQAPFEPANAGSGDPARILYVPAGTTTSPAAPPSTIRSLKEMSLRAVPRLTLPPAEALPEELDLDHYDRLAYQAAADRAEQIKDDDGSHRTADQVLGHPNFVQEDPRAWPESDVFGWTLLLAVNNNPKIGLNLADAGALYYLITEEAIANGDWDTAHVDAQSA